MFFLALFHIFLSFSFDMILFIIFINKSQFGNVLCDFNCFSQNILNSCAVAKLLYLFFGLFIVVFGA